MKKVVRRTGKKVICWWSGGITSAVACKLALNMFGVSNCIVLFIDTHNEHDDTYRFKVDCEKWYGCKILSVSNVGKDKKYKSITDVWRTTGVINLAAKGAVCSSELKRKVRERIEKRVNYSHQVFGFEFTTKEFNRAMSLKLNNYLSKPIFPLIMFGYNKSDCFKFLSEYNIKPPITYSLGFSNNNCFKTGCVQGGIGYWQMMQEKFEKQFNTMAKLEHELSAKNNKPTTILRYKNEPLYLKRCKLFPQFKSLNDVATIKQPKMLLDCIGFCGTNTLNGDDESLSELNMESE
jgi:hypothetical protein